MPEVGTIFSVHDIKLESRWMDSGVDSHGILPGDRTAALFVRDDAALNGPELGLLRCSGEEEVVGRFGGFMESPDRSLSKFLLISNLTSLKRNLQLLTISSPHLQCKSP